MGGSHSSIRQDEAFPFREISSWSHSRATKIAKDFSKREYDFAIDEKRIRSLLGRGNKALAKAIIETFSKSLVNSRGRISALAWISSIYLLAINDIKNEDIIRTVAGQIFILFDFNNSGDLNLDEVTIMFLSIIKAIYTITDSHANPNENTLEKRAIDAFQFADVNNDGRITIDEYIKWIEKQFDGYNPMTLNLDQILEIFTTDISENIVTAEQAGYLGIEKQVDEADVNDERPQQEGGLIEQHNEPISVQSTDNDNTQYEDIKENQLMATKELEEVDNNVEGYKAIAVDESLQSDEEYAKGDNPSLQQVVPTDIIQGEDKDFKEKEIVNTEQTQRVDNEKGVENVVVDESKQSDEEDTQDVEISPEEEGDLSKFLSLLDNDDNDDNKFGDDIFSFDSSTLSLPSSPSSTNEEFEEVNINSETDNFVGVDDLMQQDDEHKQDKEISPIEYIDRKDLLFSKYASCLPFSSLVLSSRSRAPSAIYLSKYSK